MYQFRLFVAFSFVFGLIYACNQQGNVSTNESISDEIKRTFLPDKEGVKEVFLNYLSTIHDKPNFNTEVECRGGKGYKIFLADLNDDSLIDAIVDYSLIPDFIGNAISEIGGIVYFKNTGDSLIFANHTEELGGNFGSRNEVKKIEKGIIYLEVLEYAPDDGRCCPSVPKTTMVRINDDDEFILR